MCGGEGEGEGCTAVKSKLNHSIGVSGSEMMAMSSPLISDHGICLDIGPRSGARY